MLEKLAEIFGIQGTAKQELIDSAALQRNEIPPDIANNEILKKALPAFFRAARGHKLTESEVLNLANDIKQLHRSDVSHS